MYLFIYFLKRLEISGWHWKMKNFKPKKSKTLYSVYNFSMGIFPARYGREHILDQTPERTKLLYECHRLNPWFACAFFFSKWKFFLMHFNQENFLRMKNTAILLGHISYRHCRFIVYLVFYNFLRIAYAILSINIATTWHLSKFKAAW